MSAIADHPRLPAAAVNAKLIDLIVKGAVGLGVVLSGYVISEPAPYELVLTAVMVVWALFGLRISPTVTPLLALVVTMNIGGMLAMTQMADIGQTPMYLAVSLFLALTAVFFAAITSARPDLYAVIFNATVIAAVVTSVLGILGYFHAFPEAEMFTKYERAAGAFKDPNVFGPFLCLPGIYLLYRLITGRVAMMPVYAVPLLIVMGGIFLSFSRGAWGLFAAAAVMLILALLLQNRSGAFRLRVITMSLIGVAIVVVGLIVILQIPEVGDLFTKRAQLVQDYDGARLGRFARYGLGFQMAMERPLGIGPLVFGTIFPEDTHDIWLKMLMDYGWLGFASYLTLTLWTIVGGFRILLRDRPWQPYLLCAYVVYLGHMGLGTVIDTDHWRHFYLLLGLIWGAMALEARYGQHYSQAHRDNRLARGKSLLGQPGG